MNDRAWISGEQTTIPASARRLGWSRTPTASTSTSVGTPFTAAEVADRSGACIAQGLAALGVAAGERVAALLENSAEGHARLVGDRCAAATSPCRSTPCTRASTSVTNCTTRARTCSWSSGPLADRVAAVVDDLPGLRHVIVVEDDDPTEESRESVSTVGVVVHPWDESARRRREPSPTSPSARRTSGRSSTPAAPPGPRRAACSATATTRRSTSQIG